MSKDTERSLEEYLQRRKEEWESWLEEDRDKVYTGALCGEYVCDCTKNYGKSCKHPDKYVSGGCE